ncbi:AbiJ-NTD4 domain-containing protein [Psychrobacter sp. AOP7-B1-24]|uniref:AbiJ-NTD4 domain-containing protein n=1 Tax=Psychrobacter sp. AOP7-B1-24 TaxID=3457645 RepID=UPI00402BBFEB
MLTDIFAYRYLNYPIWKDFTELELRLLNQLYSVVEEAVSYYDANGKSTEENIRKWKTLHDSLARELGVDELSKRYYSHIYKNHLGQNVPSNGFFSWNYVCESFLKSEYCSRRHTPDKFMKERISFIELAMRKRYEELKVINEGLPKAISDAKRRDSVSRCGVQNTNSISDRLKSWNQNLNDSYLSQVREINERFRRAKVPLTLNNGFIQVSTDEVVEKNIAKPFWNLVSDSLWKNVDLDMKEALDRRDSNDKDPALFAAKALESTIKIISDQNGWSSGKENGASNYIDNLVSRKNGRYIDPWEAEILKDYFRKIRNTLGHGPGSNTMPVLSTEQTDWAIESSMSWVRTLIRRSL